MRDKIKDIKERVKLLSHYNLVGDLKTVLDDIVEYLKGGGSEGKSAFEVWLDQPGNEGKSERDFFESLRGDPGQTGKPGHTGQSCYSHIAWSTSEDGTKDFSFKREDKHTFMGLYFGQNEQAPTSNTMYNWIKAK